MVPCTPFDYLTSCAKGEQCYLPHAIVWQVAVLVTALYLGVLSWHSPRYIRPLASPKLKQLLVVMLLLTIHLRSTPALYCSDATVERR